MTKIEHFFHLRWMYASCCLLIALCSCRSATNHVGVAADVDGTNDAAVIYSLILETHYLGSRWDRRNLTLVMEDYVIFNANTSPANEISRLAQLLANDGTASTNTIRDLAEKGTSDEWSVVSDIPTGDRSQLLSKADFDRLVKGRSGFAELRVEFPRAKQIVSFSHIGFNQSREEALVFVECVRGPLDGDGSLFVLRKMDGRWIVVKALTVWIS